MKYNVKLTPHAIAQIHETIAYISNILIAPEAARLWLNYLEKEIASLDTMPLRFPLMNEEPWKSREYRKMVVRNFNVYYFANHKTKIVWVTAVIYKRRDQINTLKKFE